MEKLFKKKTIRRIVCFLILVAPLIYMFGSLFTALNGAHGAFPFENEVETIQTGTVDWNQIYSHSSSGTFGGGQWTYEDGTYTITGTQTSSVVYIKRESRTPIVIGHKYAVSYTQTEGITTTNLYFGGTYMQPTASQNQFRSIVSPLNINININLRNQNITFTDDDPLNIVISITDLTQMFGAGHEPTANVFFANYPDIYYPYILSEIQPVYETRELTNSEYTFAQFFAQDNWLAQIGNKVINNEDAGIPAISTLLNYLEVNAFHAGTEPYGAFVYGYAIYAVNALIIYELVCIGLSIIMIPLKITDWLEKKGDMDL